MKPAIAFVIALFLALPPVAVAQIGASGDCEMRMDGHDVLRARADRILAALLAAPELDGAPRFGWEVQIVDRGVHDADAFAGGQIRLSATFVRRLSLDDAELAMLLAHEVAHVLAGDARSDGTPSRLHGEQHAVIGATASSTAERDRPSAIGIARQRELDADARGFALATRAGFAPDGLRGFYRKVLGIYGNLANATHPSVRERLRRLPATAPETR